MQCGLSGNPARAFARLLFNRKRPIAATHGHGSGKSSGGPMPQNLLRILPPIIFLE
ncbi:MAG: hypothetical protein PUB07_07190 [Clostridia bacterium]|nr:hypothetical protein [Clostridia bacterium]